ncbi:MAG: hypothetical protein M3507_07470 [Actinomycetota bacterium]|nr:hypothetical protein [Actinomycetota bacterium]
MSNETIAPGKWRARFPRRDDLVEPVALQGSQRLVQAVVVQAVVVQAVADQASQGVELS